MEIRTYSFVYSGNQHVQRCLILENGMWVRRNLSAFQPTAHFISSSTLALNGADRERSVGKIRGFMAAM